MWATGYCNKCGHYGKIEARTAWCEACLMAWYDAHTVKPGNEEV